MATKTDLEIAVKVIKEVANDPTIGAVKELIDLLTNSGEPTKEVRVETVKETR